MTPGTKIQITSGQLRGLTGEVMNASNRVPAAYLILVQTKLGKEVKILGNSQIKAI